MPDRDWSTLATLPLARAKASRVNSASGVTQQLGEGNTRREQTAFQMNFRCVWLCARLPSEKKGIWFTQSQMIRPHWGKVQTSFCCKWVTPTQ